MYTPTPYETRLLNEYFPDDPAGRADALRRLGEDEPLAYILGEQAFFGEVYSVSPGVLIPRFDTERVVEAVISLLPRGGRFADLCTGSGCVAVSTLCHRPDVSAEAFDISETALACAKRNAERNGVADRLTVTRGDVLDRRFYDREPFDLAVSNPPYIATEVLDTLDKSVSSEPRLALDGGPDGLTFYRALLAGAERLVKPGGYLVLEIGFDQADALRELAARLLPGRAVEIRRDWGGNDRAAVLKL